MHMHTVGSFYLIFTHPYYSMLMYIYVYISVYTYSLRVWSFTQLTTMIVAQAQQESDQNTRINFVHSSSPLHDLLATPTSTTVHTTLNKSRSFQVYSTCSTRKTILVKQKTKNVLLIRNIHVMCYSSTYSWKIFSSCVTY